ncbi:hypothetical protein RhiirB3_388289 [Rhizophagus irregularis]|nr:hypothetical protein RhiirB3_388289 [Rhizophagus irregularis]
MTLHLKYVKTGFSDFFGDDIPTFLLGFHIFLVRSISAFSSLSGCEIPARKSIPIGWDSFSKIVNRGCTFLDKTSLISDFIECNSKVSLFVQLKRYLKDYHRKECIILIDEYDHPLDIAYRRVQVSDYYKVKSRKIEEKMRSNDLSFFLCNQN